MKELKSILELHFKNKVYYFVALFMQNKITIWIYSSNRCDILIQAFPNDLFI